ncbi:hypothetical protein [Burkholderia cenocepacia]|uniref:hypothetical protein n=1 Tax=Burkholderia cenocepacia TaxID=95486 RepID=UPI0009AF4FA9|nr:hypothetical protein [Burkholderia cenocepacia]
MPAPLTDAELREAWDGLRIVGDFDTAPPATRIVFKNAARTWLDRKAAPEPPPIDGKRRAANDFD